jgi:hypothetical protein
MAALLRRHLAAVVAVLLLAEGALYQVRHTPPLYTAGATVVFGTADSLTSRRAGQQETLSLIATETMMARLMTSQPARAAVRARGGSGQYQVDPVNLSNMQYPDYADPMAALTAAAPGPAAAQRTFAAVYAVLASRLAALQAQANVPARQRIGVHLIGDSRPVAQPGSPARVFGGLLLLTIMAVFLVVNFLDRRSWRPAFPRPRPGSRLPQRLA